LNNNEFFEPPVFSQAVYFCVDSGDKKKHHPWGWCFPDALKGRKGEKEMGTLNSVWAQSPEERECRRESENSGPGMVK